MSLTPEQRDAAYKAQQRNCSTCNTTHHYTSFCEKSGVCFYSQKYVHDAMLGTFVHCQCGETHWWD